MECFRGGPPFTTRRANSEGLHFPDVSEWSTFVCEACTVRRILGRELTGPLDQPLLCLERMRILDMASYWARSTHSTYQGKLRQIRRFEETFDLRHAILRPTPLDRPPGGPEIPLMWCQEAYSLRPSTKAYDRDVDIRVSFSAIRQFRSAASQYMAWDALVSRPDQVFLGQDRRLVYQPCRPTDGLSYTLHSKGMRARIGDEARPSIALLDRHVRALDAELRLQYRTAADPGRQRALALAGLANLALWLGWFRSGECLSLSWSDVFALEPALGPQMDLPTGCGVVLFRLSPETKSDRSRRVDVLVAYRTMSGYNIGLWFHRARRTSGHTIESAQSSSDIIFSHVDGSPWTSAYFRKTYLYPCLHRLRQNGDTLLKPFNGSSVGNTIEAKFWSLHCYRRGARSHVSRGGTFGQHRFKKATKDQVYEHARWRYRRSSEPIDVMYREWTPRDRIKITLLCH